MRKNRCDAGLGVVLVHMYAMDGRVMMVSFLYNSFLLFPTRDILRVDSFAFAGFCRRVAVVGHR
jgi:hypothetical protein